MEISFKAMELINDVLIFEYKFYSTPNIVNKLEIAKTEDF